MHRVLLLNQQHLQGVLDVFVEHYNGHRPHRALALKPPESRRSPVATACGTARVERRDRLGGVVHEYVLGHDQVFAPYRVTGYIESGVKDGAQIVTTPNRTQL